MNFTGALCINNTCRNASNPTSFTWQSDTLAMLLIGGLIGVIPNVIILIGISRKKELQKPTYYLIANLAICDLMLSFTTIFNIILPIISIQASLSVGFHTFICKVIAIFPAYWSYMASVQTLIFISAERYHAIFRPAIKLTAKKAKFLCLLAWIISLIISFPIIIISAPARRSGKGVLFCREYVSYTIWISVIYMILFVFQYALPAAVMIILYSLILRHLRKKNIAGRNESYRSKMLKRKSIYMLMTTTVIFFIFSSPWALALAIIAISGNNIISDVQSNPTLGFILGISRLSLPFTTVYNPIVYCIFNGHIRRLFFSCPFILIKKRQYVHPEPKILLSHESNTFKSTNNTDMQGDHKLTSGESMLTSIA
ncbi:Tachykinin-like peptides receptor 86C [Trichoplax sp. H2]|nr:Tachykinin-like peptides receptor 86C [Trichoplax sp. H2]|eukprot:RDD36421.1 Tachykinin-like peptides receptor 86C [Trichoplax sp. H2]